MSDKDETPKEKLARLRAARAKRDEAQAAADEPARIEREIRNEEAVAAAVAAHGPLGKGIGTVTTSMGVIIVKRPNHMLVRKFRDKSDAKTKAWEELIRPCLVHPSQEEFEAILEEQNGVLSAVGLLVLRLAGMKEGDDDDFSGKS